MTKSTPKRYTQRQLTEIFCHQAELPKTKITDWQKVWWRNPTDPNSLRLTFIGLKFVKSVLKLDSWEFEISATLTFKHLLQLERMFTGMYFLLDRKSKTKIIVFDESEALMLTLHGNNLAQYLDHLSSVNNML